MTWQEKQIKLAEAAGWKRARSGLQAKSDMEPKAWLPPGKGYRDVVNKCPNYFGDLNAVAKLEAVLTKEQMEEYGRQLVLAVNPAMKYLAYAFALVARTTTAQRAEAIGITLGLWKEGE
jgi:hypothetical protein